MGKQIDNHQWEVSDNQQDVGTMGVRVVCMDYYHGKHFLTVHRSLVDNYTSKRLKELV